MANLDITQETHTQAMLEERNISLLPHGLGMRLDQKECSILIPRLHRRREMFLSSHMTWV